MMPPDLDIDERRAIAQPRDFPEDFDKPTTWNVCLECLGYFAGIPTRIQCRVCAGKRTV
jgi:hypothetical protein